MPLQLARFLSEGTRQWNLTWLEELPLLLATFSVLIYYGLSQKTLGRLSVGTLMRLPLVLSIGAGACLNNSVAVFSALKRHPGEIRRTPKNPPTDHSRESHSGGYSPGGDTYIRILF